MRKCASFFFVIGYNKKRKFNNIGRSKKIKKFLQLDPSANLEFFGWTTASYSVGSTISTFLFGLWNQKTMSTKYPASFGNFLMALGNLLYGLLPTIGAKKWSMLAARFIIGLGSG